MILSDLEKEQRAFLLALTQAGEEEKGIPVYLRKNAELLFVEDFKLSAKANREFEKNNVGLYRGGAIIKVISRHGIIVVPDERYGVWKPFAGMALFSEGHDLRLTGARELIEEAFIYSLSKKTRFVPMNNSDASPVCSLRFTVEKVVEIGETTLLGHEINQTNRAYEAVLQWDITEIAEDFSVSLEEQWYLGGKNGIPAYALNPRGELVGVFSGQQGFLEFHNYGIHETLRKYL